VRKFAAFAVGNAGFHDEQLYAELAPAVAPLTKLLVGVSFGRQDGLGIVACFLSILWLTTVCCRHEQDMHERSRRIGQFLPKQRPSGHRGALAFPGSGSRVINGHSACRCRIACRPLAVRRTASRFFHVE